MVGTQPTWAALIFTRNKRDMWWSYKYWSDEDTEETISRNWNSLLVLHLKQAKMCYKVECSKCGKFTWNGCGKHVASVYDGIEKGKHCTCKSWPGVDTKAEGSTSTAKEGQLPCWNFRLSNFQQLINFLNWPLDLFRRWSKSLNWMQRDH